MAIAQIGHIEPFEVGSDDWELYAERLDQFLLANGIDDDKKKVAVLVTVIGQKAYSLLRNLVAPTKPHDKKYDELVEVMKNHLKPKPLTIAERFKFNRRKQQEGESIAQFLAELRKLAGTCNFGAKLEEQLRDRLVEGLRSESIQKRLLSEGDLDLTRALRASHLYRNSESRSQWYAEQIARGRSSTCTACYTRGTTEQATMLSMWESRSLP